MTQEEAEKAAIILCITGSKALGLDTPESDTDITGVCVEPMKEMIGLDAPFEQFVRTGPDEVREGPDIQIYSLRKYLRLALSGNPTMMCLLFLKTPDHTIKKDARGSQMQELAPYIVSKNAGKAFLGYMQAQRMRLTGERGQKRVKRPELEEKYGFDTKYAMHVLRLGMQGVEILQTGRLQLPLDEERRSYLLEVRQGNVSLQEVLTKAGQLEAEVKDLMNGGSPLSDYPDNKAVEDWMLVTYDNKFSADRFDRHLREDMEKFGLKR